MAVTREIAQAEAAKARLAEFADMPDYDFIRAVLAGSRYLDNQSKENAREAIRRLERLAGKKR